MKKTKKKRKQNQKIFFLCLFFLMLSFFLLRNKSYLFQIEKIGKDSFLFIQNALVSPLMIKTEIDDSIDVIKMEKEELEKEIEELKSILELSSMLSDKVVVTANVINRNLGYFYDTVTINKGSSSGIEDGMAVVTRDGLIGKTIHVSNYSSDVQLLTGDQIGKVSVKIKSGDAYAYGLLTNYDSKKNIYQVEGISETLEISIGEEVTTTGFGDIFPSGIIVGRVSSIATDHFGLAKMIEVTPSTNVYDFSVVSVLKRNVNL